MLESTDVIFENKPDADGIMKTLCELLSRQDGGSFEYKYTLKKGERKNA